MQRNYRLVPIDSIRLHPKADLIPDMRPNEWSDFYLDISTHDIKVPIEITAEGVILDGRHRFRAAKELGKTTVPVVDAPLNGDGPDDYMIKAALFRRHLTDDQYGMIAARWKRENKTQGFGTDLTSAQRSAEVSDSHPTRQTAIAQFKTTRRKVDECSKLLNNHPELADRVFNGATSLKDARRQIKIEKLEAARAEVRSKARELADDNIKIYLGDFRDITNQIEDNSIDCIFTDPPYKQEYLPLWSDLSKIAARVLKPSGFCICYSGTYHLPESISRLSEYLTYYWQFIILHSGSWQRIQNRCLTTGYKPLLVFYKSPAQKPLNDTWDIIQGTGAEKELHKWAQAEGEARDIIQRLTNESDLILEPFAGSGTILKACKDTNRRAIGIEIENSNIDIIKGRLNG